jgi:hypothetical protein
MVSTQLGSNGEQLIQTYFLALFEGVVLTLEVEGFVRKRYLKDDTSDVGFKRTMHLPRGSTGIVPGFQPQIECQIVEATAHDENFFGIGVAFAPERSCIGSRMKSS